MKMPLLPLADAVGVSENTETRRFRPRLTKFWTREVQWGSVAGVQRVAWVINADD